MFSYGPPHMTEQKQDDQLEPTYSSSVRIRDLGLRTCQERWTIGRSGERCSGISVLAAWQDDDSQMRILCHNYVNSCIYIYMCVCVLIYVLGTACVCGWVAKERILSSASLDGIRLSEGSSFVCPIRCKVHPKTYALREGPRPEVWVVRTKDVSLRLEDEETSNSRV